MIQKKLIVKAIPASASDDGGGIMPPESVLQQWENALNSTSGAGLADYHVASLSEVGGFIWCVLEREV